MTPVPIDVHRAGGRTRGTEPQLPGCTGPGARPAWSRACVGEGPGPLLRDMRSGRVASDASLCAID